MQISTAKEVTNTAKSFANEAFDSALLAQNRSETSVQQSKHLITELEEFLTSAKATPLQVQEKALEVNLTYC